MSETSCRRRCGHQTMPHLHSRCADSRRRVREIRISILCDSFNSSAGKGNVLLSAGFRNYANAFPSSQRRGGCGINKMLRSHRSPADGVVRPAHLKISPNRPPRPRLSERDPSLLMARPPLLCEEGNIMALLVSVIVKSSTKLVFPYPAERKYNA